MSMSAAQIPVKQARPCSPHCGGTPQLFVLSQPACAGWEPRLSAPAGDSEVVLAASFGASP